MGRQFEEDGAPRIAGRLFGFLMVQEEACSLDDVAEQLRVSKGSASSNARLLERAVSYIDAHHTDCELTVNRMASDLKVSSRQLQRAYAEIGGTTFRDHLTAVGDEIGLEQKLVDLLAAGLGVTKQAILYHFASKDALDRGSFSTARAGFDRHLTKPATAAAGRAPPPSRAHADRSRGPPRGRCRSRSPSRRRGR